MGWVGLEGVGLACISQQNDSEKGLPFGHYYIILMEYN
jgi:hypothetical protein